jgi:hypothetical protein
MNPIELHVSGATVTHDNPFKDIVVPVSTEALPEELKRNGLFLYIYGILGARVKICN